MRLYDSFVLTIGERKELYVKQANSKGKILEFFFLSTIKYTCCLLRSSLVDCEA